MGTYRRPRRAHWLGGLALGLSLTISAATACATGASTTSPSGGAEAGATTPAPDTVGSTNGASTSPGPVPAHSENPGDMTDPKLPGIEKTLRGTVSSGVEANCMLLSADDGQAYLLIGGDRKIITEGARVEVSGQVQPGLMTICQQGTPFTVSTARRI